MRSLCLWDLVEVLTSSTKIRLLRIIYKSTVRSLKRQSKWPLSSVARSLLPKPANFDEVSRLKLIG